jgi:hypothetical protein
MSWIFDRRDQPEIDLVGVEQLGAARRHVETQAESSRLRGMAASAGQVGLLLEAVHEWTRIEVADGAETDGHASGAA